MNPARQPTRQCLDRKEEKPDCCPNPSPDKEGIKTLMTGESFDAVIDGLKSNNKECNNGL